MMQETTNYAGNLVEETEELERLLPEGDAIEVAGSISYRCGQLFTIICC